MERKSEFLKLSWENMVEDEVVNARVINVLEITPPTNQAMDNDGFQLVKSKAKAMRKKTADVSNYQTRNKTCNHRHRSFIGTLGVFLAPHQG